MNPDVFKIAAQIAGIGGIALVVFFYLNREVLRQKLLTRLTKQQSYRIIQLILASCCIVSLSGIAAWVAMGQQARHSAPLPEPSSIPSWSSLREIEVESFDVPYAGQEKFWPKFQEEKWSGGINAGKYFLTNAADAEGLQYIWVEMKVDTSSLPVTADISHAGFKKTASLSTAGLLYRFDQRTKYYYAFCIDRDGVYTFYRRAENGLNPLTSGRAPSANEKSDTRLGIIGVGGELRLYVNNSLVKVVQDETLKSGIAGVVAAGMGTFGFDNFTVYESPSQPPR